MNRVLTKDIVPPLLCHDRGDVTAVESVVGRWSIGGLSAGGAARPRAAPQNRCEKCPGRCWEGLGVLTKVRTGRKKSVDSRPDWADPDVFFTVGTGVLRTPIHHTIPVERLTTSPAPPRLRIPGVAGGAAKATTVTET